MMMHDQTKMFSNEFYHGDGRYSIDDGMMIDELINAGSEPLNDLAHLESTLNKTPIMQTSSSNMMPLLSDDYFNQFNLNQMTNIMINNNNSNNINMQNSNNNCPTNNSSQYTFHTLQTPQLQQQTSQNYNQIMSSNTNMNSSYMPQLGTAPLSYGSKIVSRTPSYGSSVGGSSSSSSPSSLLCQSNSSANNLNQIAHPNSVNTVSSSTNDPFDVGSNSSQLASDPAEMARQKKSRGLPLTQEESNLLAKDRQRKDNHNMIERRRRFNINDRIKELGQLLAKNGEYDTKQNKGSILKASVEYMLKIQSREEEAKKSQDTIKHLISLNKQLYNRIKELEMFCRAHGININSQINNNNNNNNNNCNYLYINNNNSNNTNTSNTNSGNNNKNDNINFNLVQSDLNTNLKETTTLNITNTNLDDLNSFTNFGSINANLGSNLCVELDESQKNQHYNLNNLNSFTISSNDNNNNVGNKNNNSINAGKECQIESNDHLNHLNHHHQQQQQHQQTLSSLQIDATLGSIMYQDLSSLQTTTTSSANNSMTNNLNSQLQASTLPPPSVAATPTTRKRGEGKKRAHANLNKDDQKSNDKINKSDSSHKSKSLKEEPISPKNAINSSSHQVGKGQSQQLQQQTQQLQQPQHMTSSSSPSATSSAITLTNIISPNELQLNSNQLDANLINPTSQPSLISLAKSPKTSGSKYIITKITTNRLNSAAIKTIENLNTNSINESGQLQKDTMQPVTSSSSSSSSSSLSSTPPSPLIKLMSSFSKDPTLASSSISSPSPSPSPSSSSSSSSTSSSSSSSSSNNLCPNNSTSSSSSGSVAQSVCGTQIQLQSTSPCTLSSSPSSICQTCVPTNIIQIQNSNLITNTNHNFDENIN